MSSLAGQTLTLFVGIYGTGSTSHYVEAYYDDVTLVGSGATPKPTATPTGAYPIDTNAFTVVAESKFETIVRNRHSVRFSTYYLPSGSLLDALVSAAQGGATSIRRTKRRQKRSRTRVVRSIGMPEGNRRTTSRCTPSSQTSTVSPTWTDGTGIVRM